MKRDNRRTSQKTMSSNTKRDNRAMETTPKVVSKASDRIPTRRIRNYTPIAADFTVNWQRPLLDGETGIDYQVHDNSNVIHIPFAIFAPTYTSLSLSTQPLTESDFPMLYVAANRMYAYMRQVNKTNVSYTVMDVYAYLINVTATVAKLIEAQTALQLRSIFSDKLPNLFGMINQVPYSQSPLHINGITMSTQALGIVDGTSGMVEAPYCADSHYDDIVVKMQKAAAFLEMFPLPGSVITDLINIFGKGHLENGFGESQLYLAHVDYNDPCVKYNASTDKWERGAQSFNYVPWDRTYNDPDKLLRPLTEMVKLSRLSNMIGDLRNVPGLEVIRLESALHSNYEAAEIVEDPTFFEALMNAQNVVTAKKLSLFTFEEDEPPYKPAVPKYYVADKYRAGIADVDRFKFSFGDMAYTFPYGMFVPCVLPKISGQETEPSNCIWTWVSTSSLVQQYNTTLTSAKLLKACNRHLSVLQGASSCVPIAAANVSDPTPEFGLFKERGLRSLISGDEITTGIDQLILDKFSII